MTKKLTRKLKKRGRKRLFKSPEKMQVKIDAYFAECDARQVEVQHERADGGIEVMSINKPAPYTVAGLSLALGFEDHDGMADYGRKYPEYSGIVKKARMRIEQQREGFLAEPPKGCNPVSMIFALKNCHGWKDKTELDQHIKSDVPFVMVYPEDKQVQAEEPKNEKTPDPAKA